MRFGEDLYLDSDAFIKYKDMAIVGKSVAIDKGFYCTTQLEVGDYVHLAPYSCVIGGKKSKIIMGHFSGLAAGSKVVCGSDDFTGGVLMNPQVPVEYRRPKTSIVTFKPFSCIGVNSVVLPGIVLEEGSVLGANSTLTGDALPWTVYAGNPAKPISKRPKGNIYEYARRLGYDVF